MEERKENDCEVYVSDLPCPVQWQWSGPGHQWAALVQQFTIIQHSEAVYCGYGLIVHICLKKLKQANKKRNYI